MSKRIFFITGASGVGKTSLVRNLKNKYENKNWVFIHFDSIGIPQTKKMIEEYGSTENWQKETTNEWIKRMLNIKKK